MSEADVIKNTVNGPITQESLKDDLNALGVKAGMILLVHSSLSKIGWVSGGAVAVILALEEVLGTKGTLIMPTHTGDLTDPAEWSNPPAQGERAEPIRQTLRRVGRRLATALHAISWGGVFRNQAGVIRSNHPHMSFSAWGKKAAEITRDHSLAYGLGDNSPLAKIHESEGWILMIGVGHENNTSLHLAEFRAQYQGKKKIKQGAPLIVEGERRWVELEDFEEHSEDDFEKIGKAYLASGGTVLEGKIGQAKCQLIPQVELVDYAVDWMEKNRSF